MACSMERSRIRTGHCLGALGKGGQRGGASLLIGYFSDLDAGCN